MKAIFIAYDQAHHENVCDVIDRMNIRGYTLFDQTKGAGSKTGDPHLGSHAWPSMNSSMLIVVEDGQVDTLLERLHTLDTDNQMLGLRAFVWDVEKSI